MIMTWYGLVWKAQLYIVACYISGEAAGGNLKLTADLGVKGL